MESDATEKARVLQANIVYHSALAKKYDETQPHFKPENVARVEKILADMAAKTGGGSLLDLGCGTGFIINIAKKYFRRIVGVDITLAMLQKVDKSGGQIELHLADTARLPLADNEVDACTAYGFLHHLCELPPTLSEAYRCLRPGGHFFADQDPNCHYWSLMRNLSRRNDLPGMVEREVRSVVSISEEIMGETQLTDEEISLAEYQKVRRGGFDPKAITAMLGQIGFRSVTYRYEWFLGQGKVVHQQSAADAQVIENFLREALPATRYLFKYISFYAEK